MDWCKIADALIESRSVATCQLMGTDLPEKSGAFNRLMQHHLVEHFY
jgi:hypothetical protein